MSSENLSLENAALKEELEVLKRESIRLKKITEEITQENLQLKQRSKRLEKENIELKQETDDESVLGNLKKLTAKSIMLYLGGFIIVMSGLVLAAMNSSDWGTLLRIFAVAGPMIVLLTAGFFILKKEQILGSIFLFGAALLVPLMFTVTFLECKLFSSSIGIFVSAASIVLYILLNFICQNAMWSLFYSSTGCFLLYYILEKLGVKHYSLFFLLPAFSYIGLGIWFEKRQKSKLSKNLYFIGCMVLFCSLLDWARQGTIFSSIQEIKKQLAFSTALIASVYLAFGFLFEKADRFKANFLQLYSTFFYFFGAFLFMGSFSILSIGPKAILYELIVLIMSLGFIFINIWKASKIFLYTGALFLVFYIFCIGGKYFHTAIGWPLTLLISGFLSIFVGWQIGRIQNTYFETLSK